MKQYHNLLHDNVDRLSIINQYAWRVVALVYLYQQLGIANPYDVKQIYGYLTLLQAFSNMCSSLNPNYNNDLSHVQYWRLYTHGFVDNKLLDELRETLDDWIVYEICTLFMYFMLMFV